MSQVDSAPPIAATAAPCTPWHRRARQQLRHSVRARMVLVFLLLAMVLTVSFVGGAQRMLATGWQQAAKPLVIDYMDRLVTDLGSPPDIDKARALTQRLPVAIRIDGPRVHWTSDLRQTQSISRRWETENGTPFWVRYTADGHTVRFGIPSDIWDDRPNAFWWTLGILVFTTALAYAYVRRVLRPLDDIAAGAKRFGAGDFSDPIPWPAKQHPDELGDLAHTVNTMGRDIRAMLEAKRALLLAISHELRSPLTRARLNTELLPETPDLDLSRKALLRDMAEMSALINDLLESERLHDGHAALHAEWVYIEHVIADALFEHPEVSCSVAADLPEVWIDAMRVRLLLRNVLSNAARHAGGGDVAVNAWRNVHGELVISVRDHGPGVANEHIAQLGQAFFRPDDARARQHGGVGLGLYLCKLVMQAHGGSLELENAQPGLRVTATFPAHVFQRPAADGAPRSDVDVG